MNKIVEQQLNNVKIADLTNYNPDTNTYYIPRYNETKLEVDSCYIICLDDVLLKYDEDSTLISNWNRGTYPKSKYMKVDISKKVGDMVLVNGLGYDYNTKQDTNVLWNGWLPIKKIKVMEKL
jgi:hypothetical protein